MTQKMLQVFAGDIFYDCEIVHVDHLHFYLRHPRAVFYDIVLPRNNIRGEISRASNVIGRHINVKVEKICIADDGVPGAFVTQL